MQQRCFVHAQNSPSTVVHGCTTVEDGSNGLTTSIILRETRTLYFLVQCSCQVFLAKNLLLISITAIRGGYEKLVCYVFPECECWTGKALIGILNY